MVVRLRLARHGTRNNPFYHIVAIRDSKPRDARPIEKLGEYDPIPRPRVAVAASAAGTTSATSSADASSSSSASSPGPVLTSGIESGPPKLEKRIEWNAARIKYWLDTGAQPSKPVAKLLDRAGLIPPGKTYKGIYKPPTPSVVSRTVTSEGDSAKVASPSAILSAAGAFSGPAGGARSNDGAAAQAPRADGETAATAEGQAQRTDPRSEARKGGVAEATVDQAA